MGVQLGPGSKFPEPHDTGSKKYNHLSHTHHR